ncbi:MAG: MFS transporter [Thaumarchaeota archaeon]|nr:MFS transporter [Candidatus Calditenuaceae archaeon]MDW8186511.1 MFS transporter [Nitrososphaerota archaeon]
MPSLPYYVVLWLVMLFGWITNYVCRIIVAPGVPDIMREYGTSYEVTGLGLMTVLLVGYFTMQLPAGLIGDRFGRKRVLVLGPVLWGTATIAAALAPSFQLLAVSRFFKGLAMGTYFGNDRPVVAAHTPKEKMGIGQGVSFSGLGIGMGLGIMLGGVMTEALGWRTTLMLVSLPPFLASALLLKFVKEPPASSSSHKVSKASIGEVFRNRDLWLLNFAAFCSLFSLWSVLWLPTVFREEGIETEWASVLSSLFGFASPFGLMFSGFVSDMLVRRGIGRKAWLGTSIVLHGLLWSLFGYALSMRAPLWVLMVLVFGAGFWQWGLWSPMYAIIATMVPAGVMGTAYGLNNFVGQMGGVSPWIIGWIRDLTGSFIPAYYVVGAIAIVGGCSALLVRRR